MITSVLPTHVSIRPPPSTSTFSPVTQMTCQKSRAHFSPGRPHRAAFFPPACAPERTWGAWASWLRTWWSSCSSARRTRRAQKTRGTWALSSASIRSNPSVVGSSAESPILLHTCRTHFPSFFMLILCCLKFVKLNTFSGNVSWMWYKEIPAEDSCVQMMLLKIQIIMCYINILISLNIHSLENCTISGLSELQAPHNCHFAIATTNRPFATTTYLSSFPPLAPSHSLNSFPGHFLPPEHTAISLLLVHY